MSENPLKLRRIIAVRKVPDYLVVSHKSAMCCIENEAESSFQQTLNFHICYQTKYISSALSLLYSFGREGRMSKLFEIPTFFQGTTQTRAFDPMLLAGRWGVTKCFINNCITHCYSTSHAN